MQNQPWPRGTPYIQRYFGQQKMTKFAELGKDVGLETVYGGSSNNNRWWKLKTFEELIKILNYIILYLVENNCHYPFKSQIIQFIAILYEIDRIFVSSKIIKFK